MTLCPRVAFTLPAANARNHLQPLTRAIRTQRPQYARADPSRTLSWGRVLSSGSKAPNTTPRRFRTATPTCRTDCASGSTSLVRAGRLRVLPLELRIRLRVFRASCVRRSYSRHRPDGPSSQRPTREARGRGSHITTLHMSEAVGERRGRPGRAACVSLGALVLLSGRI